MVVTGRSIQPRRLRRYSIDSFIYSTVEMIEPTWLVWGVIQRSVLASFNIARILTRFSVRVPDICVLFKKKNSKVLRLQPTRHRRYWKESDPWSLLTMLTKRFNKQFTVVTVCRVFSSVWLNDQFKFKSLNWRRRVTHSSHRYSSKQQNSFNWWPMQKKKRKIIINGTGIITIIKRYGSCMQRYIHFGC